MSAHTTPAWRLVSWLSALALALVAAPGPVPVLAGADPGLDAAVVAAVSAGAGGPVTRVLVTTVAQVPGWAYGTAAIPAPPGQEAPQGLLFAAQQIAGEWTVWLLGTSEFRAKVRAAPAALLEPRVRAILGDEPALSEGGEALLGLPYGVGQTWYLTGGAHTSIGGPWDAIDFAGGDGSIRAAREGIAYTPCANFIQVVHGDGWETGYYHVTGVAVSNGQPVSRGQYLGQISAEVGCGGWATGPHVHFATMWNGEYTPIAGHVIGGWTVHNGATPYEGCLSRDTNWQCPPSGLIYNDGTVGDPGSLVVLLAEPELTPPYGPLCDTAWYRFTNILGFASYLTLNVDDPAQSTNSARWTPVLPRPGRYQVEAFIPTHDGFTWSCTGTYVSPDTNDAHYTIHHANLAVSRHEAQQPLYDAWLDLGTYYFAAAGDEYVELDDITSEPSLTRFVSFSAVRFVWAGEGYRTLLPELSTSGGYDQPN